MASQNLPSKRPYDPFSSFRTELDRVFSSFLSERDPFFNGLADFNPSMDVKETEKKITLTVDLPGVEEDDIELEVHDDLIRLKGERREEHEEENEDQRLIERSYGHFERALRLPFSPNDDAIKTKFKKGVLTVTIDKPKDVKAQSRRIPIGRAL